jgi:hypothetical protein
MSSAALSASFFGRALGLWAGYFLNHGALQARKIN